MTEMNVKFVCTYCGKTFKRDFISRKLCPKCAPNRLKLKWRKWHEKNRLAWNARRRELYAQRKNNG